MSHPAPPAACGLKLSQHGSGQCRRRYQQGKARQGAHVETHHLSPQILTGKKVHETKVRHSPMLMIEKV